MRLVIDMQGAQSKDSRNRGIGRYTTSLAQAIVRNCDGHEVFLALNGSFEDTIEPIRQAFDGLLSQENIRIWQAPRPVCHLNNSNNWRRCTAELVREAFLASLKPDFVLLSSLLEGLSDDAVTSIGELGHSVPTAAILYDLIPLIHQHIYLENPVIEDWYRRKLDHLRKADLLLAISESSRQESILHLGFSAEACINISTAADPQFLVQKIDFLHEQDVRQRYGLHQPFVMYTGGIDHRKNIESLIRAYAKLPNQLRASHQLAIVCSIKPPSRAELEALAKKEGLKAEELVLTGFVSEEDLLALYNLCKAFVFPSWHEGFGLPALEAMSCGRAVIGANTSSLPEVIGRDDAMFDPMNVSSITEKLSQVLTDDVFRSELEQYGLERAKLFSWDMTAKRAIAAFETCHIKKFNQPLIEVIPAQRPRLAYLSPLPPERSGVSDYSAELLPELNRYYDIDVIVSQESVSDHWIKANCPLRSVEWFRANSNCFDRVLYHFGNSDFHQHMFSLLEDFPGIVVLHDFFLSGIISHMDGTGYLPGAWAQSLYQSHGYAAIQQRFHAPDPAEVIWRYPCNHAVLQNALGVIVHSENSRRLASQWYGDDAADDWAVIPLLRTPGYGDDKTEARRLLKLNNDDFVVCSFGLLGPTKLSQLLINAWLASDLAKDSNCVLVFVGENHSGDYGDELAVAIRRSGLDARIRITGWTETATYHNYLAAADLGVQLRTLSRGETSAAVLDCMNYGLPTIVNANGSMADLPGEAVCKLPDEFAEAELIEALETLWHDPTRRHQLGTNAQEVILTSHAPASCANQYAQAIETIYKTALTDIPALISALANVKTEPDNPEELICLAEAVALSIPPRLTSRQMLVDVSELMQNEIQNDARSKLCSYLKDLLNNPPKGFRVEPVYLANDKSCRYARHFTLSFLGCMESALTDDVIEFQTGDLFLGLDLQQQAVIAQGAFYDQLRNFGVKVQIIGHDIASGINHNLMKHKENNDSMD